MKLVLVLALLCATPCLGSTDVHWPDYHAKPWTVVQRGSIKLEVFQPVIHVITVGTTEEFVDDPDLIKNRFMVVEESLLGNGPCIRTLADFTFGKERLHTQVKVNGSWWTIPENAQVNLRLLDQSEAVQSHRAVGVQVTVVDLNGRAVKAIIFLNKEDKK